MNTLVKSVFIATFVAVVMSVAAALSSTEQQKAIIGTSSSHDYPSSQLLRRQLTSSAVDPKTTVAKLSPLPKVPATIVTAYFNVPSKTKHAVYMSFIRKFLSLQDYMVIFTTPDLVEELKKMRPAHLMERTTIILITLDETPFGSSLTYGKSFWQKQLEKDPHKSIHQSYELFWIWLSKTWFVQEAIRLNPHSHEIFVWTDIGAFRNKDFDGKLYAAHTEIIPRNSMLLTSWKDSVQEIAAQNAKETNGWITNANQLYQTGGFQAGYADTFHRFHLAFLDTFEAFVNHDLFIGEDQFLLQTTCNMNFNLCSYITPEQTPEVANWWVMEQALSAGGNFHLFSPAKLIETQYKGSASAAAARVVIKTI